MDTTRYSIVSENPSKRCSRIKPYWKQVFMASSAWNTAFLGGVAMGTNTVAIPQMQRESIEVTDEMRSWLGAIFGFGALVWLLILTPVIDSFGLKKAYLIICLSPFVGSTISYFATSSVQFLCGQIIQSMIWGSMANVILMVITEHVSAANRSLFLTIKSASIYWGIWYANAIGTFFNWRYIAATSIICSLYSLTVCFWPESPFWLASKGRMDKCAEAFRWSRGVSEQTESELESIISFYNSEREIKNSDLKKTPRSYWSSMILREFYMPMFLAFMLAFLYNSSGKFACTMYAVELLQSITAESKWAYLAMLILDGINVIGMYIGCYVAKKFNRRTLLFLFSGIGIFFLYLLSLNNFLIKFKVINGNIVIPVVFLMIFSLALCMGPMILTPTITSELVPVKNRLLFYNVLSVVYLLVLGAFLKIAPALFKLGLNWAFLINACLATFSLLVLFVHLPETRGKTTLEINEGFKKHENKINKSETKMMLDKV